MCFSMCFNSSQSRIFKLFFGVILFQSLVACDWNHLKSLKWGEDNPPTQSVKANLDQYNCLKNFDQKANAYLKGDLRVEEVKFIAGCLQGALNQFKRRIHDPRSGVGSYSPSRLADFLNKEYLSEDKPLTSDFLSELMKLKTVVVGGREDVITTGEIDAGIHIIGILGEEFASLLPYMRIYSQAHSPLEKDISRNDLRLAREQLNKSAATIAKILSDSKSEYSLASFGRLLEQFQLFLNWDLFHGTSYSYRQLYDVIHVVKELSVGVGDDSIKQNQWPTIAHTLSAAFGFYMNYQLKMADQNLQYGPALEILVDTMNESFDLIEEWILNRKDKVIPLSVTSRLFRALEDQNLMPLGLPANAVEKVYNQFVRKGLRVLGEKRVLPEGLRLSNMKELRGEFQIWAQSQLKLNQGIERSLNLRFSNFESVNEEDFKRVELLDLSQLFNSQIFQVSSQFMGAGVNELSQLLNVTRPFFKIGDNRAYIMPAGDLPKFGVFNNIQNLSYVNTMKSLVRILIRSFARDDHRVANMIGITASEMEDFHQTVKPLAVSVKLMDPRRLNAGKAYFTEANLFTFSGDGQLYPKDAEGVVSFQEALEILAILWSSSNVRYQLYDRVSKQCHELGFEDGEKDQFGFAKIDRNCFFEKFFSGKLQEFSNLPLLQEDFVSLETVDRKRNLSDRQRKYIEQLGYRGKARLLKSLESISQIPCEDPKFIESAELATMSTVLHYTEVIFTTYDQNNDGLLDGREAFMAFPRFYDYLNEAVERVTGESFSVGRLKAIFAFMIGGQAMPQSWFEKAAILAYQGAFRFTDRIDEVPNSIPDIKMDRHDFVALLASLAEAGRPAQTCSKN